MFGSWQKSYKRRRKLPFFYFGRLFTWDRITFLLLEQTFYLSLIWADFFTFFYLGRHFTFLLLGQTTFSNLGDDRVNIFPHPTKLLPDHLPVEIIIKRLQHYMPTKHLTHLLFSLSSPICIAMVYNSTWTPDSLLKLCSSQQSTYPDQLNQDLPKHRHRYRVRCADPQKGLSVQFKGCHPGKNIIKSFTQIKSESEST